MLGKEGFKQQGHSSEKQFEKVLVFCKCLMRMTSDINLETDCISCSRRLFSIQQKLKSNKPNGPCFNDTVHSVALQKNHTVLSVFSPKNVALNQWKKQQVQDNLKSLTTAVIKVQYLCYNVLSRRNLFVQ